MVVVLLPHPGGLLCAGGCRGSRMALSCQPIPGLSFPPVQKGRETVLPRAPVVTAPGAIILKATVRTASLGVMPPSAPPWHLCRVGWVGGEAREQALPLIR